jgi:hypothetical protein
VAASAGVVPSTNFDNWRQVFGARARIIPRAPSSFRRHVFPARAAAGVRFGGSRRGEAQQGALVTRVAARTHPSNTLFAQFYLQTIAAVPGHGFVYNSSWGAIGCAKPATIKCASGCAPLLCVGLGP